MPPQNERRETPSWALAGLRCRARNSNCFFEKRSKLCPARPAGSRPVGAYCAHQAHHQGKWLGCGVKGQGFNQALIKQFTRPALYAISPVGAPNQLFRQDKSQSKPAIKRNFVDHGAVISACWPRPQSPTKPFRGSQATIPLAHKKAQPPSAHRLIAARPTGACGPWRDGPE